MRLKNLCLIPLLLWLAACDKDAQQNTAEAAPPFVKTVALQISRDSSLGMTGTVRARVETPLSFQVNGRTLRRLVDSGQQVQAGQLLFELDPRDLSLGLAAAKAQLLASESLLSVAESDLQRHKKLRDRQFVSAQALQQAENAYQQASSQRDAARAQWQQAQNALAYTQLRAPAAGVVIEVYVQAGQVLAAGQAVALLAQQGEREVEVNFAQQVTPPAQGQVLLGERALPITLREISGAVDSLSRTLRARYVLAEGSESLLLGQVLQTRFTSQNREGLYSLPLAALSERGDGPKVWILREGKLHAVAVSVHHVDLERVLISGELNPAEPVVALGTHLLREGMAARELLQ